MKLRIRPILAEHAATIGLFGLAVAAWWLLGPGPFTVWLTLAAIAAPILGKALDSDEAFDLDLDDAEPCTDYEPEDHQQ